MQAVKHAADRRWRRRSARVELDRAAGFALSARSASGGEARKVELGVGGGAEAHGVRAAACAPPRRQGGDARLNIKVDPPLWAPARGQGREPRPRPVASHLPWAGLTLTPKLRGSRGLRRGRCRLVNRATSRVQVCPRLWCLATLRGGVLWVGVREDRQWGIAISVGRWLPSRCPRWRSRPAAPRPLRRSPPPGRRSPKSRRTCGPPRSSAVGDKPPITSRKIARAPRPMPAASASSPM